MMAQHADGRAAGADVYAQVTCLPLKVQIQMTNPYYFRTVADVPRAHGPPACRSSHASTRDPAWRAAATRQVPDVQAAGRLGPSSSSPRPTRNAQLIGRRRGVDRRASGGAPRSTCCATSRSRRTSRPASSRCSATTRRAGRRHDDAGRRGVRAVRRRRARRAAVRRQHAHRAARALGARPGASSRSSTRSTSSPPSSPTCSSCIDRGRIVPGAAADIVVFDPETVDPGPLRRVRDLPGDEERLIAEEPTRRRARARERGCDHEPRRVAA